MKFSKDEEVPGLIKAFCLVTKKTLKVHILPKQIGDKTCIVVSRSSKRVSVTDIANV